MSVSDKSLQDYYDNPIFLHGIEIGKALGESNTVADVETVYANGNLEEWLDWQRSKTLEEWDSYHEEHGSPEDIKRKLGLI